MRAAYTFRQRFARAAVLFAIIALCGSAAATQRMISQHASMPGPLQRPSPIPAASLQPVALIVGGTGMTRIASGETPAVLASAEVYSPITRRSERINPMTSNRSHHSAVLLPDGHVLIVGGVNVLFVPQFSGPTVPWILASTDVFDPVTQRFRAGANMTSRRDSPSATLLNNGKVLIVGGGTSSAELYDPTTGKFSETGSMTIERYGQTATLLTSGKVLVAGGGSSQAELYDPETGKFSLTGNMSENRIYHTATLLLDGRVLIMGGSPYARSSATDTTELYDPLSGTFELGPKMQESRTGHTATRLANGQVLIAGGHDDNSAEIYDPVAEQFTRSGNMSVSRFGHSATRWPDGTVLIAGGWNKSYQPLATTETYDPRTGEFTASGDMSEARADHTATLICLRSAISSAPSPPAPTPASGPTSTEASPAARNLPPAAHPPARGHS